MSISLVLALIIGIAFILIRESLISNDKVEIWNTINSILFHDITTDEGRNSLGLFYIFRAWACAACAPHLKRKDLLL